MTRTAARIIREKWTRKEACEACSGTGYVPAERDFGGRPVAWETCPVCEGTGEVYPVYREAFLEAWDLRPRSPEEAEVLREWVQAYRRARKEARLSPKEAARVATLEVYGPLPF